MYSSIRRGCFNISDNSGFPVRIVWALVPVVLGLTLYLFLSSVMTGGDDPEAVQVTVGERSVAARVGDAELLSEELALAGLAETYIDSWIEDELLAQLAVDEGLENTRLSGLVQRRARQIYLRDRLLESVYSGVSLPDSMEVLSFMQEDSLLYLVERHYYHILVADRQLADSIFARLSSGESFQITAERLSIGQKAGIGGDFGFMSGGELTAFGIPREDVVITGLGRVFGSDRGWHILMVDETRPLTDTVRVVWSIADVIYQQRLEAARDSLLEAAMMGRVVQGGTAR